MTLISIATAARSASVSADHVRRAILLGELPAYDLGRPLTVC